MCFILYYLAGRYKLAALLHIVFKWEKACQHAFSHLIWHILAGVLISTKTEGVLFFNPSCRSRAPRYINLINKVFGVLLGLHKVFFFWIKIVIIFGRLIRFKVLWFLLLIDLLYIYWFNLYFLQYYAFCRNTPFLRLSVYFTLFYINATFCIFNRISILYKHSVIPSEKHGSKEAKWFASVP